MVMLCQTWMSRELVELNTLSSCTRQTLLREQLSAAGLQIADDDPPIDETIA